MALQQSNPDLYSHVRVVISIIVGLCITTLLSGFARFVQHLGWAASLLLWIIHFWWWEFRLSLVPQWTFAIYFFVILYAVLFFLACTLLFPSDLNDYSSYEEYFLSRRKWFFGLLAAITVADIFDTSLKGSAYIHSFGIEYPIRIVINLTIAIVGMFTRNRRIQFTLLTIALVHQIFIIVWLYSTE